MKRELFLIPAVLIAAIPIILAAPGGGQGRPPGPPADPVAEALDRDHDGELSKYELRRAARVLKRLDKNRDGELSGEEIGQPEGDAEDDRQGPPPSKILEALDTDEDGVISEEEIGNAAEVLATLDTNEDGELTGEEFQPPRPDGAPENGNGPSGGGGPPSQGGPPQGDCPRGGSRR